MCSGGGKSKWKENTTTRENDTEYYTSYNEVENASCGKCKETGKDSVRGMFCNLVSCAAPAGTTVDV